MDRHLFLFGGGPPFTPVMGKCFAEIALRTDKPVSILNVERDGWKDYIHKYTQLLEVLGLREFHLLPLPSTPFDQVRNCLQNSSGVIICGGNTNLYADYIVDSPISSLIVKQYESGYPVVGFSAGALISPDNCIISEKDNEQKEFQERVGLGLLSNVVIAVHFTQWNDEMHLRKAALKYEKHENFGIDENTCAYFNNGKLRRIEGEGVYSVKKDILRKIEINSL
ncbi:Type 1 glutamine amidotransferase-like domain-containing protein [Ornithinibacillus salinisoli]|uniref:Type 1 glutamine amidotransferase-like domain-containing protein n=1 Tax=Ornithinibacillus salinisoli TaxID=1848459 RepID=A0ABW4VUN9_9BACI